MRTGEEQEQNAFRRFNSIANDQHLLNVSIVDKYDSDIEVKKFGDKKKHNFIED